MRRAYPTGPDDELREAIGGTLLHAYVAGRHQLPGEEMDEAARHLSREFLDSLAEVHRVRRWTYPSFRRAYVSAVRKWKPGTVVLEGPDRLRLVSPVCPIGADAALDPRACEFCRLFQEQAARRALGAQVEDVRFGDLIARGDATCVVDVVLRGRKP